MPGPPVTIGCSVILSPGISGPPDSGVITMIPPGGPVAGGMPLAICGSLCTMVNSLSGIPYPLPIGTPGLSKIIIQGQPLVRIGDMIPSGPGILTILGPPATTSVIDGTA